jgi:hypothetical protein
MTVKYFKFKQSKVVHSSNLSYSGGRGRIGSLRPAQAQIVRPSLKNKIKTEEFRV